MCQLVSRERERERGKGDGEGKKVKGRGRERSRKHNINACRTCVLSPAGIRTIPGNVDVRRQAETRATAPENWAFDRGFDRLTVIPMLFQYPLKCVDSPR